MWVNLSQSPAVSPFWPEAGLMVPLATSSSYLLMRVSGGRTSAITWPCRVIWMTSPCSTRENMALGL